MSGDLTVRDVIAHTFAAWSSSEAEIDAVDYEVADDVLVRLAAAGWRLERDDQPRWTGDARRCEVVGSHKAHTDVAVALEDSVPVRQYEHRCNGGVVTTWVQEVAP